MTTVTLTTKLTTATSAVAARLSFAAAAMFLALLAALHILKPELDPAWRFISEYALGAYGWLMMLAFFSLALGCAGLAVALKSHIQTLGGKLGLGLLLLSAVGMTMAAIFPTDPITTGREALTTNGQVHEVGALLDVTPIAALLLSWSLARRNPAWASARRALLWTGGLPLLGLMVFIGSVTMMLPSSGQFGPDVLVGWPNRLLVVTYCIWLMTVAWQVIRLHRQRASAS